jgi:hypothetical protein
LEDLLNNKFPALKSLPLWLAGNSLAGIYLPYILNQIQNSTFKGLLLGNPITNYKFDGRPAFIEMSY